MSLGTLLLSIWLILLGLTWIAAITVSTKFLGFWALVTGIVLLVESYHPLTIYRRPQA